MALVPAHGLYGTARALGVSYGALKRHVERQTRHAAPYAVPRFVELPATPVAGAPVIEIETATGPIVRLRLTGLTLSELAAVARQVAGAAS